MGLYLPISKITVNLSVFFIPFVTFIFVAMVNAVNLTDGLDGLAAGSASFNLVFFIVAAAIFTSNDAGVAAASLLGACASFLYYNLNPAKVFMGDTGSLALGGFITGIALSLKMTLMLPIVCLVFVIEVVSVIIQVAVFKKCGKRVFLMAPLHHHFEEKGLSETEVTRKFWLLSFMMMLVSVLFIALWR